MNSILSPPPVYPTLTKPASPPSASGTLEASPSEASTDMPSSPAGQGRPSTTYQVSVNMVCTDAQLKALMVSLAGAGTGVNMKFDPKQ